MSVAVIVGLGNPGPNYAATRHNLGFRLANAFAQEMRVTLSYEKRFEADCAKTVLGDQVVFILKPLTFMNLSGRSVGAFLRYYNYPVKCVCVLHDDIAFPLGQARLAFTEGSSGGHNGIQSLLECIGPGFWRYRLGIGSKTHPAMALADYVLGTFSSAEEKVVETALPCFVDGLKQLLVKGPSKAMNNLNRNTISP